MLPERMEDDGLVLRRYATGEAEACIAERERMAQGPGALSLGMFIGERIAGGCSLAIGPDADGVARIGYWLYPVFRGHGLATRAARMLTEAALAISDVDAVEIRHDEADPASAGVGRVDVV
jgi:RimJ/RimL family protein N-acetyltransferase